LNTQIEKEEWVGKFMVLPRIITAVVGIPVVLGLIYIGGFPYFLFITFVIVMSLYEYYIMMKLCFKPVDLFSLFFCGIIIPVSFYLNYDMEKYFNFVSMFVSLSVILPIFIELFRKEKYLERVSYTISAIFLISYNLSHLILIRNMENGAKIVFLIILSIWIGDTFAYIVGTRFGKHSLNQISPKKTIEGFVAGFISTVLFFYIVSKYLPIFSPLKFIIFGVVVSISSQFSDLAESLIKRACGVKDSSNLLPGHGGFFDRFDSYLFAAPVSYYFLIFIR
jgi:phosphatidate cytidylyltransferase